MTNHVGRPVPRFEDPRLLTGQARFIADLERPGMLEAVVLRSPVAHARIERIETAEAVEFDGVQRVLTAADLPAGAKCLTRPFYHLDDDFVARNYVELAPYSEPVLASDIVRRFGEPIALVVATDRYAAEDARELVDIDFDLLPVIVDPEEALAAGASQVHPDLPGNVHARFHVVVGDPSREAAEADRNLRRRFRIGRAVGSPIENRGVIAEYERGSGLTVWSTTQVPHVLRGYLSEMLELPEERVRVVAPDMGGSFGGGIYPEEVLVSVAAMHLGRPVRWLEDRPEDLVNARHSRDQIIDAELAFDLDGTIRALRVNIIQDGGAHNPFGVTLTHNVATHLRSVYRIDHFETQAVCAATNKTRNTPVRGAGRPEATFVIDRLVDSAAHDLGIDPAEFRMRNLIPADEMPHDMGMLYRDGIPMVYDTGDFPDQLATALTVGDYEGLRQRQQEWRAAGRSVGIGISCHVEATGLGPYEGADVALDIEGRMVVKCGSQPHGQSHHTILAQVCADVFDIDPALVIVKTGDTALIPFGGGTFGSRSGVTAASAVLVASERTRDKLLALTGHLLQENLQNLVIDNGVIRSRDAGGKGLTFRQLAEAARPGDENALPGAAAPNGITSTEYFTPPAVTFGSGTHVAVVEVDVETGAVKLLDYIAVHDCGSLLNPMVVEGQHHGGVAHGIGNILLEEQPYEPTGQPTAATLMDYLLPTALDVPPIRVIHRPHPTPLNPLGVKGAGEGATSSAPAAIANAIVDALLPRRIEISEMPITPERLLGLIDGAK